MKTPYWAYTAAALSVQLGVVGSAAASSANPDISFTLDGFFNTESTALSERGDSFGLGHTELSLDSAVDDRFTGRLTTVLESHHGTTELALEEAYLNTTGLGHGVDIRFGRFLSQVGYLNSHHTHSDAFSQRPAVYRALLGAHYFDDGIRVNTLLPTPFFWQVGLEAFKGQQLADGEGDDAIGVSTLSTKLGGDISLSHSWQFGFSMLHNTLMQADDHDHADEDSDSDAADSHDDHDHDGHDHAGHSHSAGYSAKNLYILDAVWKWAPQGNARQQQLVLSGEYFYGNKINQYATDDDAHRGWYASAVYRFHPQWQTGLRYGSVDLKEAHGDHFHDQSLTETDLMLSYSHSHFSTLRLQYTHQDGSGFDSINDTLTLHYVMSLGAHGAHAF